MTVKCDLLGNWNRIKLFSIACLLNQVSHFSNTSPPPFIVPHSLHSNIFNTKMNTVVFISYLHLLALLIWLSLSSALSIPAKLMYFTFSSIFYTIPNLWDRFSRICLLIGNFNSLSNYKNCNSPRYLFFVLMYWDWCVLCCAIPSAPLILHSL